MNFNIHATEQYNLVDFLTEVVDANDLSVIENNLREGLAETPYLILDFTPIRLIGFEALDALKNLCELLVSEEGLLVVAAPDSSLTAKLSDTDVIMLPTVDEAIDYVYMDNLEKELGADDI